MTGYHVNIHYLSSLRRVNFRVISTKSLRMTLRSPIILSIRMYYIHLQWVVVTSYFPDIEDHIKLEDDIIEDLVLGKQIKTHVHNLRPFIFSPNRVDPIELAQQNEQEFMVRDIIYGVPCSMDRL